jgi:hypothetical protein
VLSIDHFLSQEKNYSKSDTGPVRPYSPSEREKIKVSQSFFNYYEKFYPNTERFFLPPSKITGKNGFSRQN